jgi:hypothetical protein
MGATNGLVTMPELSTSFSQATQGFEILVCALNKAELIKDPTL